MAPGREKAIRAREDVTEVKRKQLLSQMRFGQTDNL